MHGLAVTGRNMSVGTFTNRRCPVHHLPGAHFGIKVVATQLWVILLPLQLRRTLVPFQSSEPWCKALPGPCWAPLCFNKLLVCFGYLLYYHDHTSPFHQNSTSRNQVTRKCFISFSTLVYRIAAP